MSRLPFGYASRTPPPSRGQRAKRPLMCFICSRPLPAASSPTRIPATNAIIATLHVGNAAFLPSTSTRRDPSGAQIPFGRLPKLLSLGEMRNVDHSARIAADLNPLPTELIMSTNPFDREDATYLALRNNEGQYSLWPTALALPEGWSVEFGPTGKTACLEFIEEHWIDMRPLSLVARTS
jgi:MbtH protein